MAAMDDRQDGEHAAHGERGLGRLEENVLEARRIAWRHIGVDTLLAAKRRSEIEGDPLARSAGTQR